MKTFAFTAGALFLAAAGAANAATYTNEATFLANIQANRYLEDFTGWTFGSPLNGSQTSWAAPGNGTFGWTASATSGLYSNNSALSTNTANQPLTITFTGAPVTAFGGFFTNTDITGAQIAGTITISLSNGEVHNFASNPTGFFGWTGNVAIASIDILSAGATNNWPQVDHFYTGAAIPAPGALALLGLAGMVGGRRRR